MTLEERIEQLEKRCRQLTGLLLGTMTVAAAIMLGGAAQNADRESVRTQKLEIVDSDGNVRIHLGKADEGYGLVVYDAQGDFNATLTSAPRGAVMQLRKDGGGMRLQAGKDGAGLSLRDGSGKPRAGLVVSNEASQIMLKDSTGKTVFAAPTNK